MDNKSGTTGNSIAGREPVSQKNSVLLRLGDPVRGGVLYVRAERRRKPAPGRFHVSHRAGAWMEPHVDRRGGERQADSRPLERLRLSDGFPTATAFA